MDKTGDRCLNLQQKPMVAHIVHPLKCQYCSRHFYGNILAFKKHVRKHEIRYHKHWSKNKHQKTCKEIQTHSDGNYTNDSVSAVDDVIIQEGRVEKDRVFVYLVYPLQSLCTCNKKKHVGTKMLCNCPFTYQRQVYQSINQMHQNMSSLKSYSCSQCKKHVLRAPLTNKDDNTQCGQQPPRNVCAKCGDIFLNSSDLDAHYQACFGFTKSGIIFRCDVCNKECNSSVEMRLHIASTHSGRGVRTDQAPSPVPQTTSNFKVAHMQSHSETLCKETVSCDICGHCLANDETMDEHLATHKATNQKNGQGDHTSVNLQNKEKVEKDQRINKYPSRCRMQRQPSQYVDIPIDSGTKKTNGTKPTVKQVHGARIQRLSRDKTKIGGKVLQCKDCTVMLKSNRELKLHMKTHAHGIVDSKDSSQSHLKLPEADKYECQACGLTLPTLQKLSRHTEKCRSRQIPKPGINSCQPSETPDKSKYACDKCPQSFLSLRQKKTHMKAHLLAQDKVQTQTNVNTRSKTQKKLRNDTKHRRPGLVNLKQCKDKQVDIRALSESVKKASKKSQRVPKYGCKKCDRVCLTIGELRQHRKVHKLRGDRLQCEECNKTFETLDELTWHVEAHKFPCRFCGIEISTPDNRKRHETNICTMAVASEVSALHQEKKRICCKECSKVFDNRTELRQHMKTHKYKCTYCNMEFTQEYTRNRHEKSKCGSKVTDCVMLDKKLECKLCGQMFENRVHWRQHTKTHKNERWGCEPCSQKFRTRADFLVHKKTHKGVWCKTCNVSFQTTSELDDHKKEHKFPCQFCGREFPTIRSCRHHTETACSNALMVKKMKPRKVRKDTGIHKNTEKCECYCDQCGKKFNNLRERNKHRGVHFKQKLSAPTKCSECEEVFEYGTQLRMHQKKVHWPEKPFACLYCKFRFKSKPELIQHEIVHTTDKPHACPICNRRFKSKKYIQHHMYMHTGARPYQCKYCPKFFRQPTMLRLHERRHRGEKPYKCIFCQRSYTYGPSLRIHLNSHVRKGDISESEAQHADEVIKNEIQEKVKVLREKHKGSNNTAASNAEKRPTKTGPATQPDLHKTLSHHRPFVHATTEDSVQQIFGQTTNAPVQLTIQPPENTHPSDPMMSHFQRLQEAHTAGSLEAMRYFHNPPTNWQPLANHQGMTQNAHHQSWELPGNGMGIHCPPPPDLQPPSGSLSSAVTSALYGIVHRENEGREYQQ